MLKLTYNDGCRLGNRLYLYAAGRLLARKLGLWLQSEPLRGFPRTHDIVHGIALGELGDHPHVKVNGADPIPSWPDVEHLRNKSIEIEHGFVNSRYFVNDRDLIKTWFGGQPLMQVDPEDVLVNVRLREFTPLGLTLDPLYYTSILNSMSFRRLYVMTDDPANPYLKVFDKYNPGLITGDSVEHFFKAIAFKRIVMSNSTFCWWFTFVSGAKEIYLPMINGTRCGSWSTGQLPAIDLRLDWPEVTHVYNIPNWGSQPSFCMTDAERAEAAAFGKQSKTTFLP